MKKKTSRIYGIFCAIMAGYLFLSFSSNPPNGSQGFTGAPTNMNTCSSSQGGCHSGGSGTGNVMITGLPSTIMPSTVYPITVSVNRTNSTPQRGGFQMTVLDANNNFVGTLSGAGPSSTTQSIGGRTLFEHSPALNFGGGNTVSYNINWTSPATGMGDITMYAAAVLGNGSGGSTGDPVVTTTSSGTFQGGGGGLISVNVTGTNVDCFGENTGTATAMPSGGGGPPYFYAWSNGGNMQSLNSLPAGMYTVTVTNGMGGEGTGTITITQPASAVGVSVVNQTNISCANPIGTATAQGMGGTPGWTYAWSNGDNGPTASFGTPGTYVVTVSDANLCTSTANVTIQANNIPPTVNAGPSAELTCVNSTVTLNGSGSASGAGITYEWTTLNGTIISGANTLFPEVSSTGTYTLTVLNNNNGCTAQDNTTVTENLVLPTADAGPAMALNCNNTSVMLDGTGSSQGANFSYQWTGPGIQSGGNTTTPMVNAEGTYSLIVTDTDNGCTAESITDVTQTPALMASIPSQVNNNCFGDMEGEAMAAGVGGNGTYTYAWSNGETSQTISNLEAGVYTVTITDADDCTSTATATITEPDELTANASATPESFVGANDGTATAEPTGGVGGFSYLWSNGETTQTITDLTTGNYTVTVSDDNMCSAVETVTVASFDCSALSLSFSSNDPGCNGEATGTATAEPAGGTAPYSYAWSNGDSEATADSLAAGSHSVTIMDANNCELTGTVTLDEPSMLTLSTTQTSNVLCNGEETGSANLSAAGGTPGYTYTWPDGGDQSDRDDLAAGTYEVTTTDANDCTATTQFTISEPNTLTANVSATDETSVGGNDGTATAPAMGGTPPFTFEWSNGATTETIESLSPGEYCVTITDGNDCQFEGCATVNSFACLGVTTSINGINVNCFGESNGSASVSATGFTEPLTYLWSNGANMANIDMLPVGEYTVTVTGDNGCSASDEIEITQPDELTINLIEAQNLECPNESTGTIMVEAEGGIAGYSYEWSNGETEPSISGLEEGEYQVMVTDENNCEALLTVAIEVNPDTVAPVAIAQDLTIFLDANGMASINAEQVDGGSTDNCEVAQLVIDISEFGCDDLGENMVVLAVADPTNNCTADTAIVTVLDDILPTLTCPEDIVINDGSCQAVVEYDTPLGEDNCENLSVSLETGPPSGSTFASGSTVVAWIADDGSGNTAACSFVVTVVNAFTAQTTFTAPTCNGDSDGTATAEPMNGTEPFTFLWNDANAQTSQTATGLSANIYTVTATDADGCSTIAEVELIDPLELQINVNEVTNETGNNMDGAIDVTVLFGQGAITFEWSLNGNVVSNEEDPSGLAAGEYTLVATDTNGCTVEATVIVDMVSSSSDTELAGQISLFPNPISESVNLRFELPHSMDVQLSTLDLTGRIVLPVRQMNLSAQTMTMDVSQLSAGVYYLHMVIDENVVVKRFIKRR